MTEIINNSQQRQAKLKELILKLHSGESQEEVREELIKTLRKVPYIEVITVEQELISEGLPTEEVLKLCDVHSAVLQGNVDMSGAHGYPRRTPHRCDAQRESSVEAGDRASSLLSHSDR